MNDKTHSNKMLNKSIYYYVTYYLNLIIGSIVLGSLSILFYFPSLRYSFKFDDEPNIVGFYGIRNKTIKDLFFSSTRWISYWLNTVYYKIAKFDPFVYRLGNLIIHTLSGIILFLILYLCLSKLKNSSFLKNNSLMISFTSAALFLLHPVQTQTITYVIQGQLEGLATLFIFCILLCFILSNLTKNALVNYFLKFLCLILGLLSTGSKEIAIVSPLLILLVDWFFISQGNLKKLKSRTLFYLLYSTLIGTAYLYLLKPEFFIKIFSLSHSLENNIGNQLNNSSNGIITPYSYFISQFKVIVHYLWIFIWPFNISADYDWKLSSSIFSFSCIFNLLIILGLISYIFYRLTKNKTDIISFSLLWFFIIILPRSSFIPGTELLADYKTYMASGMIFLLIAIPIVKLLEYIETSIQYKLNNKPKFIIAYLSPLFIFFLITGYSTYTRNLVWQSEKSFWADVIEHAPNKARAYNNYGLALQKEGKHYKAIQNFKQAIKLDKKYPEPWINLSYSYGELKKYDEALEASIKSIEAYPTVSGYLNLSYFLTHKKQYKQAIEYLEKVVTREPTNGKAWYNLGFLYNKLNKHKKCWVAFKKCCTQADYDQTDNGFKQYGLTSQLLNKLSEAEFAYEKAAEINPESKENILNLANIYFENNKFDRSSKLYQILLKNSPLDIYLQYKLAESLMLAKEYIQALKAYKRLKEIDSQSTIANYKIEECEKLLTH